ARLVKNWAGGASGKKIGPGARLVKKLGRGRVW
ncbi:MAG: hypothetical protein ACI9ZM_001268, partial [Paracoccaceae bacterium]